MEQGKEEPGDVQAERYENIVEREEWNEYVLEAEYDGRWQIHPRFKIAYLAIAKNGRYFEMKEFNLEPLLEKGLEMRFALRYVIQVTKTVITVLNSP